MDRPHVTAPRWAVIVAGVVVDAVFRLEGWEPAADEDRWSFVGAADPELESRYVGRSVAAYLAPGGNQPVTYVWCGPHWVNTAR